MEQRCQVNLVGTGPVGVGLACVLKVLCDSYEGGRKAYDARLILVRPNQRAPWPGGALPQDPAALLRTVAGIP